MPSEIRQTTAPGTVLNIYSSLPPDVSTTSDTLQFSALTQVVTSSFPDKIRRPRPVDLFANATPWERSSSVTSYGSGEIFEQISPNHTRRTSGPVSFWGGPVLPGGLLSLSQADFGQLDLKMRLKIRNGKVDLYSTIAEARQTSDMMFNLFRDLTGAVKRLKSGQTFATLVRTLQAPRDRTERRIANRWLEYQYGVIPTLNDIYGLAEAAVTRLNAGFPMYLRTRSVESGFQPAGGGLVIGPAEVRTIKTVRARYVIKNTSLAKATELGLTNPAASAYNLIPWSFVVDWAFSVGDFLEGLDALLGVDNLYVQRGVGRDIKMLQSVSGVTSSDPTPIRYESKERMRLPVTSDLSFGSPRLQNPFGGTSWKTRLANATALLQQFRR